MKPLLMLGPWGQKVLWGGLKSVCLFPPSEVTLIIRNRRRCILVCMEFKVCPTPLCRHLSSFTSLEMGQREACWFFLWDSDEHVHIQSGHFQNSFSGSNFLRFGITWNSSSHGFQKENTALCAVCPVSSYPTWSLRNIDCSRQPCKVHFFNGV